MSKITQANFDEWMDGPITQGVLNLLREEALSFRNMAAAGYPMQAESFAKMGERYFSLITTATVYENLLENLTFDNVFLKEETLDDNDLSSGREPPAS